MGSLFEWITDWIKEGLIDAITGQYTSIFNSVNNQVADVANQVRFAVLQVADDDGHGFSDNLILHLLFLLKVESTKEVLSPGSIFSLLSHENGPGAILLLPVIKRAAPCPARGTEGPSACLAQTPEQTAQPPAPVPAMNKSLWVTP